MFKDNSLSRRVGIVSIVICLLVLVTGSSIGADLPDQWLKDFEAAKVKAAKDNKPILAVFSTSWCGPCKSMVKNVYPEEKVIAALNSWVPVYIDGDVEKELMKTFKVSAFPTFVLLDASGRENGRFVGGAQDGAGFLERIDNALHMKEKLNAVEEKLAASPNDVDALIEYGKLLNESDRGKATEMFKKAFELNREKCKSYDVPMLNHLIAQADFEAKMAEIGKAIENDAENPALLQKRAEAYLGDSFSTTVSYYPERIFKALEYLRAALKLDPENKTLRSDVAFFEAMQLRDEEHTNAMADFAEKYPDSIRTPFALYFCYSTAVRTEDTEKANKILDKLVTFELKGRFGEWIASKHDKAKEAKSQAGAIGNIAPKLAGLEWVKGDAVEMKKDSIYVIEFWATWCPPCRTSIPHLTELQHKYKDKNLAIIGISGEGVDKVKPFVEKQAEAMNYAVAIDTDGEMNKAYMKAFGQGGIPHAFIVDKEGNIAWHGHPMMMDEVLEGVSNGTFDSVAYAKQQAEAKEKAERTRKNYTAYFENVANKSEAKEIGLKFIEDSNSQTLNAFAWRILTEVEEGNRDVKMALRAAKKANDLEEGSDPAILDTYALALFEAGKIEEAFKNQKSAVELSESNGRMHAELKQTLDKYVAALKEKKSAS